MKAQLWIFAGPNGAGKSTLVAQYVRGRMPVINPDEVVQSNQNARRFYERLGAEICGEREERLPQALLKEVAYGWLDVRALTA